MIKKQLKSILPVVSFVFLLQASSCTKGTTRSGVNYTGSTMLSFGGGGLAAAAAGNKILFAGGIDKNGVSKTVDIYDVPSNSWTTAQLSQARNYLVAGAAGNKVLFAGGLDSAYSISKTVDIYDVLSNTWTTAQLSEARFLLAAGATGNKILFAGGSAVSSSNTVDIYDVSSNTWTTAGLSEARSQLTGGAAGNKILFAGGLANYGVSKTVDIYDVSSNTWTTAHLSEAREALTAATAGNKILFGGGNTVLFPPGGNGNIVDNGDSKTVDIYNASSNTWTTDKLSEARESPASAGSGNKILFAGGAVLDSSFDVNIRIMTSFYRASKTVDIFTVR